MKRFTSLAAAAVLAAAFAGSAVANEAFRGPLGVLANEPGVTEGYVLLTPQGSKTSYLIDNNGKIVNKWESEYKGFWGELKADGTLSRHGVLPEIDSTGLWLFGGAAGIMEEFDWNGNKIWEYKMYIPGKEVSHHTYEIMPNGNYLLLGWEFKSYEEALAKGMKPTKDRYLFKEDYTDEKRHIDGIWPDFVREVDRATGKTVWEWHVWDHIGKGKNKIDINKFCSAKVYSAYAGPDWTHFNGVAYNPDTDQIAVTSRNLAEVFVIDRKTGDIVYRWGNPANYGAGKAPAGYADDGDQKLWGPHAPDWLPNGNLSIIDNGARRPSHNYTRAVELDPKTNAVVWQWTPMAVKANPSNFYSHYQDGAQKLPNGNWMLTTSNDGHVIEVTSDKNIVWELANPVREDRIYKATNIHGKGGASIHKALRYPADFPGFQGKKMKNEGKFPNWTSVLSKDAVPMPGSEAPKAAPVKTYKRVVPAAE